MTESGDVTDVVTWIRGYVAEASTEANVAAFVGDVDAAILAALPELAEDPVLVADLHASTKAQFQIFLSLLDREEQELLLPPQAVDLALSIARRQFELGVLLKIYRVASASVWEHFTGVAAAVPDDGPNRTDVLIYLWDHGGTWINEAIEQLIGVFYAEREATMHGALARRGETVHALLRGDPISTNDVTVALEHPVRDQQTAIVLWTSEPAVADALATLNNVAGTLGRVADASMLMIPAGRGEVWVWLATRHRLEAEELREVFDQLHFGAVRAGIGTSLEGIDGFRDSHCEAVEAQRHAISLTDHEVATFYADVELACLVAGNERGARNLIDRELGRLCAPDAALDRVRETVSTFLRLGASVEQTAATLFVHKNTVRYRLAQAEELIGHPLTERRTEVAVALRCWDRFLTAN